MENARKRLLERQNQLGHQAKKSLGQNFLVSDHVIQKILSAVVDLQLKMKSSALIEIGPGLGALTDLLIPMSDFFQAIELDRSLYDFWKLQNLNIINEDALKMDWRPFSQKILVSNLPYQISSSLVIEKSIQPYSIEAMVLMFQKEVAQRIRAVVDSDHYGMLSVIAQEFWVIDTVCDAGPVDFNPSPKVASRVLKFIKRESEIKDKNKYLQFIKQCFQQRRRILKSNLPNAISQPLIEWLKLNNFSEKVRAEELSPKKFRELFIYLDKNN